jgi:hypothetical protein
MMTSISRGKTIAMTAKPLPKRQNCCPNGKTIAKSAKVICTHCVIVSAVI